MHLFVAVEMFAWAVVFWFVKEKVHLWVGVVVATLCNGVLGAATVIPIGGMGLFTALLPGLVVGSAINIVLAALAFMIVERSGLI